MSIPGLECCTHPLHPSPQQGNSPSVVSFGLSFSSQDWNAILVLSSRFYPSSTESLIICVVLVVASMRETDMIMSVLLPFSSFTFLPPTVSLGISLGELLVCGSQSWLQGSHQRGHLLLLFRWSVAGQSCRYTLRPRKNICVVISCPLLPLYR